MNTNKCTSVNTSTALAGMHFDDGLERALRHIFDEALLAQTPQAYYLAAVQIQGIIVFVEESGANPMWRNAARQQMEELFCMAGQEGIRLAQVNARNLTGRQQAEIGVLLN